MAELVGGENAAQMKEVLAWILLEKTIQDLVLCCE